MKEQTVWREGNVEHVHTKQYDQVVHIKEWETIRVAKNENMIVCSRAARG